MTQLRVGLIGTGRISDIYLRNAGLFDELDIVACGSLNRAESEAKAAAFGAAGGRPGRNPAHAGY